MVALRGKVMAVNIVGILKFEGFVNIVVISFLIADLQTFEASEPQMWAF